jgi:hypothetical protein
MLPFFRIEPDGLRGIPGIGSAPCPEDKSKTPRAVAPCFCQEDLEPGMICRHILRIEEDRLHFGGKCVVGIGAKPHLDGKGPGGRQDRIFCDMNAVAGIGDGKTNPTLQAASEFPRCIRFCPLQPRSVFLCRGIRQKCSAFSIKLPVAQN